MWRRAVEALGADADQWLALVRTGLRLDFRRPALATRRRARPERGPFRSLIGSLFLYFVSGVMFGVIALVVGDVLVAGTLVMSAIMFMVAATILVEFHTVVISPDDYLVLGHLPVSSSTYFAARLANLLFYVLVLSTALGLPSMAAFFVEVRMRPAAVGFRPLVGLAGIATVYAGAVTVALAMVGLYAGLLRVISASRLKRVLTYVQIALSMVVYGSYLFLPQILNRDALAGLSRARSPWLLADPASWFACYLVLASGGAGVGELFGALASLALLAALTVIAFRYLSLDYSERLSALATASDAPRVPQSAARRGWLFRRGEGRAVALLIRNQFKQDMKFRLGVLSIFPLTVFYFLYGLRAGPMPDPFVSTEQSAGQWFLLHFAMLLFPMTLLPNLSRSDAFHASWIFYASPASKSRLILAMKDFVLAGFLLPYLATVGVLMAFFFTSLAHVLVHLVVLALVANITLLVAIRLLPHLPFSRPIQKGERSTRYLLLFIVTSMVAGALFPVLTIWVYRTPLRTGLVVTALVGINWLLERMLRANLDRLTATLEFAG
jgi:ABC-2 type transport system permease protein